MIRKIDHLVITTKNFDICKEFYEKLGFTAIQSEGRLELFAGDFKINVHKFQNELTPHAKFVQVGSADLCFEVENLTAFKAMLIRNHIDIEINQVQRTGVRGSMVSTYIRDCDGNLLEFCQYQNTQVKY